VRIVLINQFYPPDIAPTGKYLHDFARTLKARGHEVVVLCSTSAYSQNTTFSTDENLDGILIHRVWSTGFGRGLKIGRVIDYLSFLASLSLKLLALRPRADIVVALTTPPYLGLIAQAITTLNNSMMVHWIMDVYPDVLAADRMLDEDTPVYRAMIALTRLQMRAPLTFCLGDHMKHCLSKYFDTAMLSSLQSVPLWAPAHPSSVETTTGYHEFRKRNGWSENELVFMYSGNMGSGHRFSEFLSAARSLGDMGPQWVFIGDGRRRKQIEVFINEEPRAKVSILPYVKPESLFESLGAADVHLISQSAEWQGVIVPSKTQCAFFIGRPVIFVGDRNNEVADWIHESGAGWIVPENDHAALLRACKEATDPVERDRRGKAAKAFAQTHFNYFENSAKMAELLETTFQALRR